jgi:hypothetical protein
LVPVALNIKADGEDSKLVSPRLVTVAIVSPLARAVALAAGDKSVPPELLARLHSVLQETRLGGGLYLQDVVNLALDGRADTHLSLRPAGPTGDHPGSRRKRHAVRLPGAAPPLPDPAPLAAAPRVLSQLPMPPTPPPPGSSRGASPAGTDSDQFSVELSDSGSDHDPLSPSAPDSPSPSLPAAAHHSSPSPPPDRRPTQWSPSTGRAPTARPTLQWQLRARHTNSPTPAWEQPYLNTRPPATEQ